MAWSAKRRHPFDEGVIDDVETVLLGRPEKIEAFVADNLTQCLAGNAGAWSQWAKGLKSALTAGECNHPLDYTMFDYLDIGTGWQRPLKICKGDRFVSRAPLKTATS